jgi:hypothetical protein
MIAFLIVLLMIFETTFLEAQAKYRSTWDATTHRKTGMFPHTEEELNFINGKWK